MMACLVSFHTIANSCGDDAHRIKNNKTEDRFYAGKKHALLILNHLKKIKDEKPDLVKQILSATDIQGKTPFLLAIMTRNYQIAEMLLDLGAANLHLRAAYHTRH